MLENSSPIQSSHDLGRFADLAALQAQYPAGRPGDFARLTSTETIFSWNGAAWIDTLVDAQNVELKIEHPESLAYGQSIMDIHKDRVKADAGKIYPTHGSFLIGKLKELDVLRKTKLLYAPDLGGKERESGVLRFAEKGYSITDENDLTQTTELNQPYLRGNIANNESLSAYSGGFENKCLLHSDITFEANEEWSLSIVFNWNGCGNTYPTIASNRLRNGTALTMLWASNTNITLRDELLAVKSSNIKGHPLANKNSILTLSHSSLGDLTYSLNGLIMDSVGDVGKVIFNTLIRSNSIGYPFNGKVFYYRIQSGAMTAEHIAAEAAAIRTWLPEVESVKIGMQEWATSNLDIVSTPLGKGIKEMQLGANEEKITVEDDRTFASDTGFYTKSDNITIADNLCHFINAMDGNAIIATNIISVNKWQRVTFEVKNYISGAARYIIGNSSGPLKYANGIYTAYAKSTDGDYAKFYNASNDAVFDIDNVSIEEVGWAGLGDLYTWLTTEGGYSESDALKEVAAWCYYDNDPAHGAIYGKLYNWYAVKQIQDDIDAYNLANPTIPWGWHIPTSADWTILDQYADNRNILKAVGDTYWGADNNSNNFTGFTALGSGERNGVNGVFSTLTARFRGAQQESGFFWYLISSNSDFTKFPTVNAQGISIRLVKD